MKVLLDTTIQIDRIFGSNKRIERINEVLKEKELITSTYVLGEYFSNLVYDYIILYNIFLQERDVRQTGCRITENVFGRHQNRMFKLFNDLASISEYDAELMEENLDLYLKLIIERFYEGIDRDLLNGTDCNLSKAEVVYEDGIPQIKSLKCSKKENQCEICHFWKERENVLKTLLKNEEYGKELKEIIESALEREEDFKGRNCKKLGDTIIAVEIGDFAETCVCSSNASDFQPICDSLGVMLLSPDYKGIN